MTETRNEIMNLKGIYKSFLDVQALKNIGVKLASFNNGLC
jgi:ABC-type sugar transport system ATPase subunit